MKKSQWLYEVFTYILALLFLFTALSKLVDFRHFVREINNQVFPKSFTPILVIALPGVELLATYLLLRLKSRMKGLWLSLYLMAAFTIYVGLVTFRVFPRVPCACAGVFKHMSWTAHLIFNIGFTAIAATAIWLNKKLDINKMVWRSG